MRRKILCINSLDARYCSTYRLRALRDLLAAGDFEVDYLESRGSALLKLSAAEGAAAFRNYDLLLTQKFNPITIAAMAIARLRGKPVITDWDDLDVGLQGNLAKKSLARVCEGLGPHLATRITTHNETILERARRIRPADLIPQGFDGNLFRPDPTAKRVQRKRWGFPETDFVVGHLCTFTTGGTLDLDVILGSWGQKPLASARFFLIGGGPREGAVRKKVRSLGLEKRVVWSGLLPQEEIPNALGCLDASVVFMTDTPANRARVSFKVIESLAMNVPVVGQVVGETARRFGIWVHPATRETLAEVTARIGRRKDLPETAPAVRPYEWNAVAKQFVEIVGQVLEGKPPCS